MPEAAEAAVVEPAVASDSLDAWQALLAAELTPVKALEFGRQIASGRLNRESFLTHQALTANEAKKAARASRIADNLPPGISLIPQKDYPELLHQITLPPAALFCWGDFEVTKLPTAAIVGTRGASTYGRAVATKFAEAFARAGVTVVSGGAVGIDAAAHKGALAAGGKTVAVVAGSIDSTYPAANIALFEAIRGSGCLISQFAMGTKQEAFRFIVRNGLIAALSQVTVLIEAPARSGGLSTAHSANEFGRHVFVVPANIDNRNFAGSHALIRDGATLVDHPDQVLEAMDLAAAPERTLPTYLSDTARLIHNVLTMEPKSVDKISELTGLDAVVILSDLTMLEVEGAAMRDGPGYVNRL